MQTCNLTEDEHNTDDCAGEPTKSLYMTIHNIPLENIKIIFLNEKLLFISTGGQIARSQTRTCWDSIHEMDTMSRGTNTALKSEADTEGMIQTKQQSGAEHSESVFLSLNPIV